jgi:hypothetical protein
LISQIPTLIFPTEAGQPSRISKGIAVQARLFVALTWSLFLRKEVIIMKTKRWQDWLNLLLGAWLFASPWLMNYASELTQAAWNAWIFGAAIVLFAAVAVSISKAWEEVINALLGMWVAVSPWVLGFASSRDVTTNAVAVGALVALLAIWAMALARDSRKRWRSDNPAT